MTSKQRVKLKRKRGVYDPLCGVDGEQTDFEDLTLCINNLWPYREGGGGGGGV